jgi:hypothetical protein
LARAIANRRADQAVGLALICPVGAHTRDVPQHEVLVSSAGRHGRAHRPVGVGRALPSRYVCRTRSRRPRSAARATRPRSSPICRMAHARS